MLEIARITFEVIAPIFLIFGVATLVGRIFQPDTRTISTLSIYIFNPALIYTALANVNITPNDLLRIFAITAILSFAMIGIGLVGGRALRLPRPTMSAFILSLFLINTGNYGIPLNRFAFGEEAELLATTVFALNILLTGMLGVFIASSGTGSVWSSLRNVATVPELYASTFGLISNFAGITLPLPLERATGLAAEAALPLMMVLLGLQIARTQFNTSYPWRAIVAAALVRLFLSPLLVFGLVMLFGFTGMTARIIILQHAMPTAIVATAYATQFKSDSSFASVVVVVTTLGSSITLGVLIWLVTGFF